MSELTLKRLEYFSTVADEGNVTALRGVCTSHNRR